MIERLPVFMLLAVSWLAMLVLLKRRVLRERYSVFPAPRRIPPPPPRRREAPSEPQYVTVAIELPERCSTDGAYECPLYAYMRDERRDAYIHYCRAFDTVLHQAQSNLMDIERCDACKAATVEDDETANIVNI